MWAEINKVYELTERVGYYNYYAFNSRTGYRWPGVNSGRWRPPLTKPEEVIRRLNPGTRIKVKGILYQAVSGSRGKYQSVDAEVEGISQRGFVYLYHNDDKYFKEVEEESAEPREEESAEARRETGEETVEPRREVRTIKLSMGQFMAREQELETGYDYKIIVVPDAYLFSI
jgi:hypothetical protein